MTKNQRSIQKRDSCNLISNTPKTGGQGKIEKIWYDHTLVVAPYSRNKTEERSLTDTL